MRTPHPSAEILTTLDRLRFETDAPDRGTKAWQLLLQVAPNPDFHIVHDFVLEHGLVQAFPAEMPLRDDGLRNRTVSWVNPVDGIEMIWIPGGPFLAGKDNTPAELRGFSLARFPVTNEQFHTFLEATGYIPARDHPELDGFLAHWDDGSVPDQTENQPVTHVSYVDALHYCRWAGLTLPTE